MIKNYLKIAFRNLWKNKVYSLINIVGLAISMAAFILIALFVMHENSFDQMHSKQLYRLDEVQKFPGMNAPQKVALSMFPMGPSLKNDYPEIKDFTRIQPTQNIVITQGEKRITIPSALWADANFFQMFNFKLREGDIATVLKEPNTAVLSEKSALNIFGTTNCIGKSITHYGSDTLTMRVSGIMENVPSNSHLQFDALLSFSTVITPESMNNWGGNWLVTYLKLSESANIPSLEKKFPAFLKKYIKGEGSDFYQLFLQPVGEIHANSGDITHDYANYHKFDKSYTRIFSVIGIIVLVIACVNFMNLSTARSTGRAKEVGVRKSIGALRQQLASQFIGESVLLCLFALVLAVALVLLLLPVVTQFSQRELTFSIFTNPWLLLVTLFGAVLIGLFSGLYPAVFLSSFEPVKVLKGTLKAGASNFRNALVITQFSSAVFLVIATWFAVMQLNYMANKNPGFNKEQVMLVPLDSKSDTKYGALKDALLNLPQVEAVTGSQQRLGNNFHQSGVSFQGNGPVRKMASSQVVVDPDYLSLYKIKLIAGRNFTHQVSDNARTYIINESLAKKLLEEEPGMTMQSLVGKRFGFSGMDSLATIVGIAQDFNFNSLHHKIETLCLFNQKDWGYSEMSVRIRAGSTKEAVNAVGAVWNSIVPDQTFNYSFLDQHFEDLYRADTQVSQIVGILAGLAIFISCLGLFGLASYSAERRVKEIGVRKVMGASVPGIVALLSKDFVRLVLIAILIASPVAWWAVTTWLQDFAYRVNVEWWVFAAAGVMAIAVALLTISFQSIRAALTNPIKSLRSE